MGVYIAGTVFGSIFWTFRICSPSLPLHPYPWLWPAGWQCQYDECCCWSPDGNFPAMAEEITALVRKQLNTRVTELYVNFSSAHV